LEKLLNRRPATGADVPIDPKLTAEPEQSTAEPSTGNPPPRQKKTTKRQAAQAESSNKRSRTADNPSPLEALEAHATDFKNTMSGFQDILSRRTDSRLETQRLPVEEAKYLVELEKGKGTNDIATKKAKFEAAMARYPLLVAQWEESGRTGPRPEVPDFDCK
jgi:hypothetical protein